MSEIPFLLTVMLTFYFLCKSNLAVQIYRDKWFLLSLLFMGMAYYIRTQGLAIFFAVVFYLVFQKKWRHMMTALSAIILIMFPWHAWQKLQGGNPYLAQYMKINPYNPEKGLVDMGDMAERIFSNIWRYFSVEIPGACFPAF